ncbi:hypothetical protein BB8028_0010g00090 [Beauveria bassiana]|uniref:Uncharacterized protein n=1 Tax=Beauveria bassiana TaxID=176275 RepID=A0A2S7YP93_BEABA|nr:hypothetical protein BB8028_0010g00090 [Beauveria bassiana]
MQVRMEGMGNKNNTLEDELQKSKQQHDANLEELNNPRISYHCSIFPDSAAGLR